MDIQKRIFQQLSNVSVSYRNNMLLGYRFYILAARIRQKDFYPRLYIRYAYATFIFEIGSRMFVEITGKTLRESSKISYATMIFKQDI